MTKTEPALVLEKDDTLLAAPRGQVAELKSRTIYSFTQEKSRALAAMRAQVLEQRARADGFAADGTPHLSPEVVSRLRTGECIMIKMRVLRCIFSHLNLYPCAYFFYRLMATIMIVPSFKFRSGGKAYPLE